MPSASAGVRLGFAAAVSASAIALALVGPTATSAQEPSGKGRTGIVRTREGEVIGVVKNKMRQFLGIPYAAPPVGGLRWKPPQPHQGWTMPLHAVAFGNTCAQNVTLHGFAAPSEHEDCLFLNVFTPIDQKRDVKRPVMVWIHGGGLFDGASNDYDPNMLVGNGDVVFVSMNYRLNVFGFLAHPALDAEGHDAGNYGLMDQQFALKWVQRNIEAFGGDPGNVTIFGESAGGSSVWANMASPAAAGLFHRAIAESAGSGTINSPTLQSREAVGQAFAAAVGCADQTAACMRAVSARDILTVNTVQPPELRGRFSGGFMVDGTVLSPPRTAFSTGEFNRVPLINGSNRDEFTWFQALTELDTGHIVTAADFLDAVMATFGANAPAVLAHYPLSDYPTPSNALAAVTGDRSFVCGARRAIRLVSRFVDTYAYEFNVRDTPIGTPPVSFPYRAAHTGEIQYLFPRFHGATGPVHDLNRAQKRLATHMVRYWTTFARTGTPNSPAAKSPFWPRYEEKLDHYQRLEVPAPITFAGLAAEHHCDFWDSIDG